MNIYINNIKIKITSKIMNSQNTSYRTKNSNPDDKVPQKDTENSNNSNFMQGWLPSCLYYTPCFKSGNI